MSVDQPIIEKQKQLIAQLSSEVEELRKAGASTRTGDPHSAERKKFTQPQAAPTRNNNWEFTPTEHQIMAKWAGDCYYKSLAFNMIAGNASRWDTLWGCAAALMLTLSSALSLGGQVEHDGVQKVLRISLVVVSVCAALLSFIYSNLQYKEQHERYKSTAASYISIYFMILHAKARSLAQDTTFFAAVRLIEIEEKRMEIKELPVTGKYVDFIKDFDTEKWWAPLNSLSSVARDWCGLADSRYTQHKHATKYYHDRYRVGRIIWITLAGLATAGASSAFIKDAGVVLAVAIFLLNVAAASVLSVLTFRGDAAIIEQHQLAATKWRNIRDHIERLLSGGDVEGDEHKENHERRLLESLPELRASLVEIAANAPIVNAHIYWGWRNQHTQEHEQSTTLRKPKEKFRAEGAKQRTDFQSIPEEPATVLIPGALEP